MCTSCGCEEEGFNRHSETISVRTGVLAQNERMAQQNREHFDGHHILVVNLMSSPGAGKTSLLEKTIEALQGRRRIAVIVGDLATENDAARIRARGIPAVQVTTGNACHLDAAMIHSALHELDLVSLDVLFIENVGNLVCPAVFDLGQHKNVVLLSTPEGDDKPSKYPVMFRAADLVLISKSDLLPYLGEFDPARAETRVRELGVRAPVLIVSASSAEGMDTWLAWLETEYAFRSSRRGGIGDATHHHHAVG